MCNDSFLLPDWSEYPDVVTIKQLQQMLNIGKNSAYKMISSKELCSIRIGSAIRISKKEVTAFYRKRLLNC